MTSDRMVLTLWGIIAVSLRGRLDTNNTVCVLGWVGIHTGREDSNCEMRNKWRREQSSSESNLEPRPRPSR
jgi:hypothetical protein